ncbi:MAG: NADH-quinone oxidoreductase subunit C [Polyangiaceae bacterium]|nr:NADH-quinone oxidoreductase subunit C [Polyangiaceae bacterium]MCW5791648.1 NADH-quinone oxidoreductase subunit C [Polyangiaceae bacterium]
MSQRVLDLLIQRFPQAVLETHAQHGDETAVVEAASWAKVAEFLKASPDISMEMLTDLTAVDYLEREPRFEIVAHFYSLSKGHRLRLKTRVGNAQGEGVEVATLVPLWAAANWMERECYDLFGVRFVGHPDLRRILMYPEFEGHPLRKDYIATRTQPLIEYRDAPNIDKVAPFGFDEGMSFGRQTHQFLTDEE